MGNIVAQLYAKLGLDSAQFQKGMIDAKGKMQGFGGKLGEVTKGLTGFSLGSITAAGAVVGIINQVRKAVDETVAYNSSIKDTARLLGMSTEETSRLVQAADDLFLSEDKLKTAMQAASRQGIDVSVEGLKKLSDKYLALNPGVERAQFLMQTFGRSGADMYKLMEQGAAGIDKAMAAVENSLVVTDKSIKATDEYKQNLDKLADAWMGVKVAVGNGVIPVLNAFLSTEKDANEVTKQNIKTQIDAIEQAKARGVATAEMIALLERLKGAERDIRLGDRFDEMNPKIQAVSTSVEDLNADLLKTATSATDWETAFTKSGDNAAGQFDQSLNMIRAGLQELGPEGENAFNGLLLGFGKISPAAIKAYAETQIVIQKIKDMLAQGYSIDIIVNYVQNWQKGGGTSGLGFTGNDIGNGAGFAGLTNVPKGSTGNVGKSYTDANGVFWQQNLNPDGSEKGWTRGHASGGSFLIPMSYGYEGFQLGNGDTASGGEKVTITPKGKDPSGGQIILTDEQLKKIGEASGNATAVKLMQLGVLR